VGVIGITAGPKTPPYPPLKGKGVMCMKKILINILTCLPLLMINNIFAQETLWENPNLAPLVVFFNQEKIKPSFWPTLSYIKKTDLPPPYDYLLTQPLMTTAIEHYYQRTAQIQALYQFYDAKHKINSRGVMMYVDKDKNRDNALLAKQTGQAVTAELGLISMNFAALPEAILEDVTHSSKPFGALLVEYHIPTKRIENRYFKISCQGPFLQYFFCKNGFLFGRSGTLVRTDDHQWVAQVVEILP
jgi:hypothetical protein